MKVFYLLRSSKFNYSDLKVIPYTSDQSVALGFMKQRHISKDNIAVLPEKEFDKMFYSSENGNTYLLSQIFYIEEGNVYVIDDELELIDGLGDDIVYGIETGIDQLLSDLKYIKCKEAKELSKAIKKFRKDIKKKDRGDFSLNLYNVLDPLTILKHYDFKKGDK